MFPEATRELCRRKPPRQHLGDTLTKRLAVRCCDLDARARRHISWQGLPAWRQRDSVGCECIEHLCEGRKIDCAPRAGAGQSPRDKIGRAADCQRKARREPRSSKYPHPYRAEVGADACFPLASPSRRPFITRCAGRVECLKTFDDRNNDLLNFRVGEPCARALKSFSRYSYRIEAEHGENARADTVFSGQIMNLGARLAATRAR